MDLILWRHAEAVDGSPDHSRELNAKGRKQADKVAAFLRKQLPDHVRILVSPALRARQTASALTEHFTLTPNIAPGASAAAILHAARWPDGNDTVLVVGHQPALGAVAAQLLDSSTDSLSIKKGALWWFSRHGRDGADQTSLRLVIGPEFL